MRKISINENNVWAGDGTFAQGEIRDCPAILGNDQDMSDDAYEAIEQAIQAEKSSVTIGDYTWTWDFE